MSRNQWYRVRKTWADVGSQLGAYKKYRDAVKNCPPGYAAYNESGKPLWFNAQRVTEILYADNKPQEYKEGTKVVIKQVGYTYIFQISTMIRPEEQERIREKTIKQMKEGIVFLNPAIKLISVEPHLEAFVEQ